MGRSCHFIIKDERDFESEKKQLLELIKKFNEDGPAKVGLHPCGSISTTT